MTAEMGKLRREALAELDKCAAACDYYAEQRRVYLRRPAGRHRGGEELRRLRADRLRARDHAVELPDLAGVPLPRAGADGRQRRGLLKHATNVPRCADAIEAALRDAGLPDGRVRVLHIVQRAGAQVLIADPRVPR